LSTKEFQKIHGIVGQSVEIKEIVKIIQQVAITDLTILITGESGSGKEIIAKTIYQTSNRKSKNLITVNCGAIPEGILESELFGHEKGAFTGAIESRKGYFELANHGTIFLDEIGELQPQTQVKFLRILENGEFMRVGSSETLKVDVRVIAATNQDLEMDVHENKFRADLYYRLRAINIKIPPLRKRKEDIPLLFDKFVSEICNENKIKFKGISKPATDLMLNYGWPGNVRELKNVVKNLIILHGNKIIEDEDVIKYLSTIDSLNNKNRFLPVHLNKTSEQAERELILRALIDIKENITDLKNIVVSNVSYQKREALPPANNDIDNLSLKDLEKQAIIKTLEKTNFNKRQTAKKLGISERTLYRKMKDYNFEIEGNY
jgi:transcriptional regulator with GAF, ATPase, and Fis domain